MNVTRVRWFHPDGEKMPNGVFFQRGGWVAECRANAARFKLNDHVGLVVFPSGAKVEGTGRAFEGSYVSERGIRYDGLSPTRALEGISGQALLKCAGELAMEWKQPEVLVREADGKEIWVVSMSETAEQLGAAAQQGWTIRNLSESQGAYNGVRWWARRAQKAFGAFEAGGVLAFQERSDKTQERERAETLREAARRVAETFGEFREARCFIGRGLALVDAYRGVGASSPVLLVDGVAKDRLADFAKAVCASAGEQGVVVWSSEGGELWWVEKHKGVEEVRPKPVDENREAIEKESRKCEEWVRRSGRVVVARARVEDWFAPEGVFRFAWISLFKRRGCGAMEMALRWKRKDGEDGTVAERVLVVSGASVDDVVAEVAGVPGAVCREVQVGEEVKGDGRWLEEVFGERPEGESNGEWVLEEAGHVEPPRPSVFGRHDRYFPIRERGKTCVLPKEETEAKREPAIPATAMKPKIRAVSLLQWMGPRAWTNKAEELRVPGEIEKALRSGHYAWFRVDTGEGVPTSRCWMVFNAPGEWGYWKQYGVTRVLDVCPEGCRGYWSWNGKSWWKVEACAPRGKGVRVWDAKAAYWAACGQMPWDVPFFDGSGGNRIRMERMYGYVRSVLERDGMDEAQVDRRLERAATAVGFNRWATRGMLYGGRFEWGKGEMW